LFVKHQATVHPQIELKTETGVVTYPQNMAEMLNACFVEMVKEIIKQNNYPSNTHIDQPKRVYFPNSIFVFPITENEVEYVIKNSKLNFQHDMMKYRNM